MRLRSLGAAAFAVGLVLQTWAVTAQEALTYEVTLEPRRATVGDRLTLVIRARHDAALAIEAPVEPGAFTPLDLVEVRPPETGDAPGGLSETRFEYVLAAFQTGTLAPPPLPLTDRFGQVIALVELPDVEIDSVIPSGDEVALRELKGPLRADSGPPKWIWAALLMAGFAGLTVVTMVLARVPVRRSPPPPPPPAGPVAVEPPDAVARRELDAVTAGRLLERGELVTYYARIASVLRAYLTARFDMPAIAMTPPELAAALEAAAVERLPVRLAVNVLEQCHAVQFAAYEPARERAEADLSSAFEVVALTALDSEDGGP